LHGREFLFSSNRTVFISDGCTCMDQCLRHPQPPQWPTEHPLKVLTQRTTSTHPCWSSTLLCLLYVSACGLLCPWWLQCCSSAALQCTLSSTLTSLMKKEGGKKRVRSRVGQIQKQVQGQAHPGTHEAGPATKGKSQSDTCSRVRQIQEGTDEAGSCGPSCM